MLKEKGKNNLNLDKILGKFKKVDCTVYCTSLRHKVESKLSNKSIVYRFTLAETPLSTTNSKCKQP